MAKQFWSGDESRKIIKRVVVEGDLVLQTPAHFGNGDGDDLTDMPLLLDPLEGKPLLTGTSIAGALRSYLRGTEKGYRKPLPNRNDEGAIEEERNTHVVRLFGGFKGDDDGEQSPLIVDDALGRDFGIEMRDGVCIHAESRTAEEDKLFNLQLWQAGTTFRLRFELLIREGEETSLKQALATALSAFTDGGITLGARKRRGYGQVSVTQWRVTTYDLTIADGLLTWIVADRDDLAVAVPTPQTGRDISALLGGGKLGDARNLFTMKAIFTLDGSLLIRSGSGRDDKGPDMVHLHSVRANSPRDADGTPIPEPVLSGTSLGGALRARALKIANTLDSDKAQELIDAMFGKTERASKLSISENVVEGAKADLVQNRVSIDRFTGGARETALFNEQPAFGGEIVVDLRLINPKESEIGLLLLLLKDLWTGDLPLGGESSVGRGRLKGKSATLTYRNGGPPQTWQIVANGEGLTITGDREALDYYVKKHLKDYFDGKTKEVPAT
jgi:CRISPR/Cas system CSM-associated protein Csm3 (group 7 of RAMP superfamily)